MGEKVQFDLNADFGDSNYKSCFARSIVVNAHHNHHNSQQQQIETKSLNQLLQHDLKSKTCVSVPFTTTINSNLQVDGMQIKKECQHHHKNEEQQQTEETGNERKSRSGSDLPVENLLLQSQVNTLQWQLKQAESSREMYRAVMQQVVRFLERAHQSLDSMALTLNDKKQQQTTTTKMLGQWSRSEFSVPTTSSSSTHTTSTNLLTSTPTSHKNSNDQECATTNSQANIKNADVDGYSAFRDFTWRRPKRVSSSTGTDYSIEKLSQEAFRLLRTAQSLLSTREPDLAHVSSPSSSSTSESKTQRPKDQEFITQLAREFPSRPQRATSFSINPQLINRPTGDKESVKIATAFNRKLSLQRCLPTHFRLEAFNSNNNGDVDIDGDSKRSSITSFCKKSDHTLAPKTGSVSSAEDESGFSSLNSFQEVGLPSIVNATATAQLENVNDCTKNSPDANLEKAKLIWKRSNSGTQHRRWSSTPVDCVLKTDDALKVLWV